MRRIRFLEKTISILYIIINRIEIFYLRIINKFILKSIKSKKTQSLQKVSFLLTADQITEPYTRQFPKLDIKLPASFRSCLVNRTIMNQTVQMPEWKINHKPTGNIFANQLGLKTPIIIQDSIPLKDLILQNNTVIKPVTGSNSKGVFIVMDDFKIFDISNNKFFQSPDELNRRLSLFIKTSGNDEWIVEEYISKLSNEPAHDLKFYCFYGQIGIVHEVSRYPSKKNCWWSYDGKHLEEDANENGIMQFIGDGVFGDDFVIAKKVSLEIPAPFVRIDFLKGKDGLYFCEFTPRPGCFYKFNKLKNIELGHLYLEAEVRLNQDLLQGKKFQTFFNSTVKNFQEQSNY